MPILYGTIAPNTRLIKLKKFNKKLPELLLGLQDLFLLNCFIKKLVGNHYIKDDTSIICARFTKW